MTVPAKTDVDEATRQLLAGLAEGDIDLLEQGLKARERWQQSSGLDPAAPELMVALGLPLPEED